MVTVVLGPPCAGKTTFVRERLVDGDVVVDYDAIAGALGSPVGHGHPDSLHPFVCAARDALVRLAVAGRHSCNVWVITTDRHAAAELARRPGVRLVRLRVSAAECKQRAVDSGRPARWADLIDVWFTGLPPAVPGVSRSRPSRAW